MEQPTPTIGQRWESHNTNHGGWLVDIIRVSELQVETESITPHKGQRQAFPISSFIRDWHIVKNPVHTIPRLPEQDPKPCSVCTIHKPLSDYPLITINRGKNKGKPNGHGKMCKQCATAARTAGMHKKVKQLPPIISSITQKQLTQQLTQPTTLSNQLLTLASQVEALEHNQSIANQYSLLLSAARDIVVEAEATFGVIVIKQETFTNLEKAVISLKEVNS